MTQLSKFILPFLATVTLTLGFASIAWSSSVAFVGDSITTGAATHDRHVLDQKTLFDLINSLEPLQETAIYREQLQSWGVDIDAIEAPRRLPPSEQEFQSPFGWFFSSLWLKFSSDYLDAETYSWGYLSSLKRGINAQSVLIAAQDGARMRSLKSQLKRILAANNGVWPAEIFIFYTGNDICGVSEELLTPAEQFKYGLEEGLEFIRSSAPAKDASNSGTQVYVLNPIGILQIVTQPTILDKKVKYRGQEVSCRDLQRGRVGLGESPFDPDEPDGLALLLDRFVRSPAQSCPSLFAVHENEGDWAPLISNRIVAYREAIAETVEKYNKLVGTNLSFHHLTETADIVLNGEDIANDCFHLSLQGQMKVATTVNTTLRKK